MTGYQHSEIVPLRCIRYTKFFFSASSILSNLSDVSVPKLGLHWEDCEKRTKRKSLKDNDDPIHPHRVMVM